MDYQIEDYIINFLARKESPEDVQKLKEWLAVDPAHRDELKQWLAAWDMAAIMDAAEKVSPGKAYQRFMFRMGAENKGTTPNLSAKVVRMDVFRTISRIAAIFVISFSLGILFHNYWTKNHPEQIAFIENTVPMGSKSEVKLPDGSTVSLNAGSTLRYPVNYGRAKRDVYLEGEGYFKITKQTKRLFTVHTALANIKDLGTEFNVRAYPDEDVMETILINGELSVENGETLETIEHPVLLKQGQKLTLTAFPDAPPELVVTQLNPDMAEAEVSWKERYWRIESMPLQVFADKVEKRYDVNIHVDEQLKSISFSATFENESLEQVLRAIQVSVSTPILYRIDGKNVSIHIDPKKRE